MNILGMKITLIKTIFWKRNRSVFQNMSTTSLILRVLSGRRELYFDLFYLMLSSKFSVQAYLNINWIKYIKKVWSFLKFPYYARFKKRRKKRFFKRLKYENIFHQCWLDKGIITGRVWLDYLCSRRSDRRTLQERIFIGKQIENKELN